MISRNSRWKGWRENNGLMTSTQESQTNDGENGNSNDDYDAIGVLERKFVEDKFNYLFLFLFYYLLAIIFS